MDWGEREDKKTFVWNKKLEKDGIKHLTRRELELINKRKKIENVEELEKIKKRRLEIEKQKQERDEDMCRQQRFKEVSQFEEWQKQEERFHLDQARLRSQIRIKDGRAKPIDLLAQYISEANLDESIEMQVIEPYNYLNGLTIDDYEDLLADIKVYNELERGKNQSYWDDLKIIAEHELNKLRKTAFENSALSGSAAHREGVHQSVAKDVTDIFKGKTSAQLEELQAKIEKKISCTAEGLDIGYWESLKSQLKAHLAKARLTDQHLTNLKLKLEVLKSEQLLKGDKEEKVDNKDVLPSTSTDNNLPDIQENNKTKEADTLYESDEEKNLLENSFKMFKKGGYSPQYIKEDDLEAGTLIITPEVDEQDIENARQNLLEREDAEVLSEDLALLKEAKKGMTSDEVQFSVESQLDAQMYLWSDKYRPRKPRYFNRVHTGFEWNKYNQTHYDMDNPPPKIVQGYKFNIFYPDLIDKSKTPEYFLIPCPENPDFVILKICAGAPYEDVAFKIVNREWEFSYKRGFRCQFHNNIFQLWFHFKRYRYRR